MTHEVVMEFPYHHRPTVSRLETYQAEIIAMRANNWPFHKIARWFDENHQIKLSKEAVRQFCKARSIGGPPKAAASASSGPEKFTKKAACVIFTQNMENTPFFHAWDEEATASFTP